MTSMSFEHLDEFLRHFDPSVVNPTLPVNFMQEDTSPEQPASEFDDWQDSSYERTLQAVPGLISLLDADVNNENYAIRNNPTESGMADIGTLHAELPIFDSNLGEATGANFQGVNYNATSYVSRVAHFSLRQAQETWNYVRSPTTSEQASGETERVNESRYSPYDTVSSLTQNSSRAGFFNNYDLPNNTETSRDILYPGFFKKHSLFGNSLTNEINKTMPQEKPPEILCSGPFSSLLFGNSLYSANPEPVSHFSSVRANTNEQALASSAYRTSGSKSRGRSRRRRGGPVTQESADPIVSPPGESTAEPNHGRITRSRRRQTYYEIENPVKKRSRRKVTSKSTASSRPEAEKKKRTSTILE